MNRPWLTPPWPLLTLAVVVFAASATFPFVALDDARHIWQNPFVMNLSWANVALFWKGPYYGLYIPLTYTSWALLAWVSQLLDLKNSFTTIDATGFHTVNVVLHVINIYLAWVVLTQLLHRWWPGAKENSWLATLAAAVFALHPLQVESVVWASGFRDIAAAHFGLLTLWQGLRFLETRSSTAKSSKNSHTVQIRFVLFGCIAMLFKPNAVVLPLICLLMTWRLDRQALAQVFKLTIPHWIMAILVIGLTKSSQPNAHLDFFLPVEQRPWLGVASLGFYIFKFFELWPLAPDYGLSPPDFLASAQVWLWTALGLTAIGLGLVAWHKRWDPIWMATTWVGVGLLPVLGLVPFEFQNLSTVADRYFYFFPALGVGLGLAELVRRLSRPLQFSLPCALILSWGILSFLQSLHWQNNDRLFRHTLDVNPKSYLSLNNLGLEALRRRDHDAAQRLFQSALEIKPLYLPAIANLGIAQFRKGDYEGAIEHYLSALHRLPPLNTATFADIHFNLAAAYIKNRQADRGLYHLRTATQINPSHFLAQYHLGLELKKVGDRIGALQALAQALRLHPNHPTVLKEIKELQL